MDDTTKELGSAGKLLLAAATQLAIILASRRREALKEAAQTSAETAKEVEKLQAAEHQAAKPIIANAKGDLSEQPIDQLARTYEACQTWKDVDPEAKQGAQTIEAYLDKQWPDWRTEPLTAEVGQENSAHTRANEASGEASELGLAENEDVARKADRTAERDQPTYREEVNAWARDQIANGANPEAVRAQVGVKMQSRSRGVVGKTASIMTLAATANAVAAVQPQVKASNLAL